MRGLTGTMRRFVGDHTMKRNALRYLMVMSLGGIAVVVLVCTAAQRCLDTGRQVCDKRIHWDMDAGAKSEPAGAHSKIRPPADIFIEVIEVGDREGPVSIAIHASSLVPVQSGAITIAALGDTPGQTEQVWSTTDPGLVAEAAGYTSDPLPEGLHRFIAAFEFVPGGQGAETVVVAESLFLDVRPDTVLSSNVSFEHIKRIELLQELEQRALVSLKPTLAGASRKTRARERASLETRRPGAVGEKIAQIITHDPDVARRIDALNRIEDDGRVPPERADEPIRSLSPPGGDATAREVVAPLLRRDAQ